jgi:hypothetical protein
MGIFDKWFRRAAEPDPAPNWSIVKAVNAEQNQAAILRLRTDQPVLSDSLNTAIEVTWAYESSSPFPDDRDNQRMLDFERALDELSSENGYAELMQVSTGNGVKEWLYYSSDRERFMSRMNALLENHSPYPIAIRFYDDPRWEIWKDTLVAVAQRTEPPVH